MPSIGSGSLIAAVTAVTAVEAAFEADFDGLDLDEGVTEAGDMAVADASVTLDGLHDNSMYAPCTAMTTHFINCPFFIPHNFSFFSFFSSFISSVLKKEAMSIHSPLSLTSVTHILPTPLRRLTVNAGGLGALGEVTSPRHKRAVTT